MSDALFPIRIVEALQKIQDLWVSLDPDMQGRFLVGQDQEKYRHGSPPRVAFTYLSASTDKAQKPMHQGQGSLGVRRVQLVAHIWGKSLDDAEDLLMAFAAIGSEAMNPSYFNLLSEDWTTSQALHTNNGAVVLATFEIVLPLMRLPWELARVQQMPIKQTVGAKS